MRCTFEMIGPAENGKHLFRCSRCKVERAYRTEDADEVFRKCGSTAPHKPELLSAGEQKKLFGDSDPTLLGNRLAALTEAIGIPPCGGCGKRKAWINQAHQWLRDQFKAQESS